MIDNLGGNVTPTSKSFTMVAEGSSAGVNWTCMRGTTTPIEARYLPSICR